MGMRTTTLAKTIVGRLFEPTTRMLGVSFSNKEMILTACKSLSSGTWATMLHMDEVMNKCQQRENTWTSSSSRTCAWPKMNQQGLGSRSFSSSSNGDGTTHSDFETQYKPHDTIQDVAKVIESDIKSKKVFVYMKGIPDMPQCGFSNMVCRILDTYDIEYGSRNVLEDMEVRQGVKDYTSWPTIPQIFVDGEFVGGCDILMEMHKNGELEEIIK